MAAGMVAVQADPHPRPPLNLSMAQYTLQNSLVNQPHVRCLHAQDAERGDGGGVGGLR